MAEEFLPFYQLRQKGQVLLDWRFTEKEDMVSGRRESYRRIISERIRTLSTSFVGRVLTGA